MTVNYEPLALLARAWTGKDKTTAQQGAIDNDIDPTWAFQKSEILAAATWSGLGTLDDPQSLLRKIGDTLIYGGSSRGPAYEVTDRDIIVFKLTLGRPFLYRNVLDRNFYGEVSDVEEIPYGEGFFVQEETRDESDVAGLHVYVDPELLRVCKSNNQHVSVSVSITPMDDIEE